MQATLNRPAEQIFDALACGEEVEQKKPAPDLFRLALERLQILPTQALAIEDSVNGLNSALSAGVQCLITPSIYTKDEDFSNALAVVSHLGDFGNEYDHIAGFGFSTGIIRAKALKGWLV
jgi:beta-phosphoglucomutase-like phosphatase (HAD superfamily)